MFSSLLLLAVQTQILASCLCPSGDRQVCACVSLGTQGLPSTRQAGRQPPSPFVFSSCAGKGVLDPPVLSELLLSRTCWPENQVICCPRIFFPSWGVAHLLGWMLNLCKVLSSVSCTPLPPPPHFLKLSGTLVQAGIQFGLIVLS